MAEKSGAIKYLLGIDGGGTKTEFLLTDLEFNEINRVVLGASNPVNLGIENTFKVLEKGVSCVCNGVDKKAIAVFAGLAGGISADNQTALSDFLISCGFGACGNGGDTDNVIKLALADDDGVAVIMGTGIIAFSVCQGVRHRIGGWGYMIDKGASGFSYGSDALENALRCADGRGGSEAILKLVEKKLGAPVTERISEIYRGGAAFVASFAPLVFEAYNMGDLQAKEIIERNTRYAAEMIAAGLKLHNAKNVKTVICGGLCGHREVIEPFLKRYLGDGYEIEFLQKPPVYGALAIAKSMLESTEV